VLHVRIAHNTAQGKPTSHNSLANQPKVGNGEKIAHCLSMPHSRAKSKTNAFSTSTQLWRMRVRIFPCIPDEGLTLWLKTMSQVMCNPRIAYKIVPNLAVVTREREFSLVPSWPLANSSSLLIRRVPNQIRTFHLAQCLCKRTLSELLQVQSWPDNCGERIRSLSNSSRFIPTSRGWRKWLVLWKGLLVIQKESQKPC